MLSFDPGVTNFGYCVTDFNNKKYRIHESGIVTPTLRNINSDVSRELKAYARSIRKICDRFPAIEMFIAERFMTRGISGPLIESVSMMLGRGISIVESRTSVMESKFITAAVWKNEVNRTIDLKEFYKVVSVTPHQVDAFMMGAYTYYIRHLQSRDLFSLFLTNYPSYIRQLERTSLLPLIKRKNRGAVPSNKHRNRQRKVPKP